jgi:hypothetical protein
MSALQYLLLPPPHHATAIFQRRRSAAIPMLFDCCLLVPMLIVLASLRLIQRHRPIYMENSANTSTGMVQFQYWASTGAHTGISTAAMEFISSTGTCQVPYQYWQCRNGVHLPVLEMNSITAMLILVRALGKCLYQYWHGYSLPKLVNSIVLWKNCDKKENTSEFEYGYQYRYCAAPYRYW